MGMRSLTCNGCGATLIFPPHQGEAAFKIKVMGGGTTQRVEERSSGCSEEEGNREVKIAATVFTLLTNDFLPPCRKEENSLQYRQLPHGRSESGLLTCYHGL